MFNEKNIVKIIAIGPLIFIPLIVIAISLFIAITSSDNFKEDIKKLESELVYAEKTAIKTRVDSIVSYITYRKSVIKKSLTSRVKKRVDNAYKIATNIYEQYKDTKSDKEIKDIIITALRPFSWNDGESFIWILDYKGFFYLAPDYLSHLEKTSIINFKDATGKHVIKEEIATCRDKKEGFLWDTFTKQNEDSNKQFKQVVFVKAFGHYDWYFGSGEYLDTANRHADENLLESLKKMYGSSANYVMVNTMDGDILLHRNLPELIGKNVHDINNPVMLGIYDKTIKLLSEKDSAFGTYSWINQATKEKEIKHGYVRKVSNSNWVVASGFFESTIKNLVAKKSTELYKIRSIEVKNLLIISVILILISLIISYIISRELKKRYILYQNQISYKSVELEKLNENLEHRVTMRTKELEELTHELEILATTDSLTHIHNRYSIMNILNLEIHRSRRSKQSLSIIMYDIDYFKDINDTYGHDTGDKVLFELTNVVKNSLRDIDFLGRYGGEEFLVIMPTTSLESAKEIGERVRKEVEKHNFNNDINITISLGLVQLNDDESRDEIFKRLDNLLYDSKRGGRNRLSF